MISPCPDSISAPRPGRGSQRWIKLLILSLCLSAWGCSTNRPAPLIERENAPHWRPGDYRIKPGDTLYSIAWEFGLDYRELARWNRLSAPHKIISGNYLKLAPQKGDSRPPTATRIQRSNTAATRQSKSPPGPTSVPPKHPPQLGNNPVTWQWPTSGKLIGTYSSKLGHNRGLDISGNYKQPIKAAASGVVVYAGEGLKAYGKMIIVKHSERYLSAYANNHSMKVSEGERVKAGENIASMGRRNDGKTVLHFEIRRDGKPVNPLKHLPRRG